MKVTVTDMEKFLKKIDACDGDIYLVYPQGGTENIRQNPRRQAELVDEWRSAGQHLELTLDLEEPMDAAHLLCFIKK